MKCVLFLICLSVSQVFANLCAQEALVDLRVENSSFTEVINILRSQTKYSFLFNSEDIKNVDNLNINVQSKPLKEVIANILQNTGLYYKFLDNTVVIIKTSQKVSKQEKKTTVRGKVLDKDGNGLPGVSIVVKGTNIGVSTDIYGNFELKGNKGDILVISFIGMAPQEVKYLGEELKITLQEELQTLDEIIVSTGYQKIERRHLTSSVITVKKEDVFEVGKTSIDNMLQGKVAGVTVLNPTSTPGAVPKIRIRGTSTITGNREPIWVVDGVILEDPVQISNEELNSMDYVNLIGNAISFLNPEDIENIHILKDASATAIYGAKAGNGVIVITTKKGEKGRPKINYSFSTTLTDRPDYKDMYLMNSEQRIGISEEMVEKGISYAGFSPISVGFEKELDRLWGKEISYSEFKSNVRTLKEMNTDWYDLLFRNSISTNHSISLSGGDDYTTYYFSASYSDQKGTTIGVDYKKYNASLKINSKLSKSLDWKIYLATGTTKKSRHHSSIDLFQYAYETSRSISPYDENRNLFFYDTASTYSYAPNAKNIDFNIFNELQHSDNKTKNTNISFNTSLNWRIIKDLNFETFFAFNNTSYVNEQYAGPQTNYISLLRGIHYGEVLPEDQEAFKNEYCKVPFGGEYGTNKSFNKNYTFRHSLRFSKNFDSNHIGIQGGIEFRSSQYTGENYKAYGYYHDRGKRFVKINASTWPAFDDFSSPMRIIDNKTNFISYYSILTYAWNNKYIINANFRADGSNKFGQDKKARFLPVWSVSSRWNLSKENFINNIKWIDNLSLHASYGIQGNVHSDQVPNLIVSSGALDTRANEYISTVYKFPNDKLKWEKTTSYNMGIDFSFFNGIISGCAEGYFKKGTDIIVVKNISPTNGANSVALNRGTLENKGIDLTINSKIINNKNVSLSFSFNAGKNYNKIIDSGEKLENTYLKYLNGSVIVNGKAINTFYSYQFDGLDNNGLPTFKNLNQVDESGEYYSNIFDEEINRVLICSGKREPDLTGGFSTFFRYKNLSLNGIFNFSIGNKIRLNSMYSKFGQRIPMPNQNMSTDFVNRWQKSGDEDNTNIPVLSNDKLTIPATTKFKTYYSYWEMYDKSDLRMASGDFLKCREISLSYKFNRNLYSKLGLSNLSLTGSVSNVFTIADKKLKGRDPEQVELGSGTVPPMTTLSFRLNASF